MGYSNYEGRHSGLDFQWPIEYHVEKGFIRETLVEKGVKSGPASGV